MNITPTTFKGLFVLEPKIWGDSRGYFMESFSKKTLLEANIDLHFVQDNQSSSKRGVLRGLHFQNVPYAQSKLVRALSGSILDVVVDLRKEEQTFGMHYSIELSADNKKQLLVPKGFAHGFVVLSKQAEVFYKCDAYYHPESDGGILFNDPSLKIDWKLSHEELTISEKDKNYPVLSKAKFNF